MNRTVTKITPSGRVKDRFYIDFDDGQTLTVGINQIADHSIYTGRVLDAQEYEALFADAQRGEARARALRMLGARPMSKNEVAEKLRRRGVDAETSEDTAGWLEKIGAVNDEEYAGQIVRHYAAKGYGLGRIKDELYRRGVPRELWEAAMEEMPDTEGTVYRLLVSRLKTDRPGKDEIAKAANALYRRGFSWDEIKRAINMFETGGSL